MKSKSKLPSHIDFPERILSVLIALQVFQCVAIDTEKHRVDETVRGDRKCHAAKEAFGLSEWKMCVFLN